MDTPLSFQVKEREIGGCTYKVEPLGFVEGRKAFVRLANLLGPMLGSLERADRIPNLRELTDPKTQAAAFGVIADAIGKLLVGLKDDDLVYFTGLFAPKTRVLMPDGVTQPILKDILLANPKQGVLEDWFIGARFPYFFAWLALCLESTYGDFFSAAFSVTGKAPDAANQEQ